MQALYVATTHNACAQLDILLLTGWHYRQPIVDVRRHGNSQLQTCRAASLKASDVKVGIFTRGGDGTIAATMSGSRQLNPASTVGGKKPERIFFVWCWCIDWWLFRFVTMHVFDGQTDRPTTEIW